MSSAGAGVAGAARLGHMASASAAHPHHDEQAFEQLEHARYSSHSSHSSSSQDVAVAGAFDNDYEYDDDGTNDYDDNGDHVDATLAPAPIVVASEDPDNWRSLLRAAAAEFVASALFAFVVLGTGTSSISYTAVGPSILANSLVSGFGVTVISFAFGHLSGAHINVAVTLTFFLLKRLSFIRLVFYFFGQLLGGLVGIGFVKLLVPPIWWRSCFASTVLSPVATPAEGFLVEFALTFFLLFAAMASSDSGKSNQVLVPVIMGCTVFCACMIGIPVTGCSLNPTRSFASAVAASGLSYCDPWTDHWIFWTAPPLGAISAGFLYDYCFHAGGSKVDNLIDMYVLKKKPATA